MNGAIHVVHRRRWPREASCCWKGRGGGGVAPVVFLGGGKLATVSTNENEDEMSSRSGRQLLASIDEFLAREQSVGPAERTKPTSEFKAFNQADLDVQFLLSTILRGDARLKRLVCIPDFVLCAAGTPLRTRYVHKTSACPFPTTLDDRASPPLRVRGGILLTGTSPHAPLALSMPAKFDAYLARCRDKGQRFVVCNFGLYRGHTLEHGHANGLVFDLHTNTIERYEPYGRERDGVDRELAARLTARLPGWRYVGVDAGPTRGAQSVADSYDGMCVTFSLMYVLLRVLNPDVSARDVHASVRAVPPALLRATALRLNRHAIDALRAVKNGTLVRSRAGAGAARRGRGDSAKRARARSRKKITHTHKNQDQDQQSSERWTVSAARIYERSHGGRRCVP